MIELRPEHLLTVFDVSTVKKLWKFCSGGRVYFPKVQSRNDEIIALYDGMSIPRSERIKQLSELYEMSTDQIRRITKKQRSLFEEY